MLPGLHGMMEGTVHCRPMRSYGLIHKMLMRDNVMMQEGETLEYLLY